MEIRGREQERCGLACSVQGHFGLVSMGSAFSWGARMREYWLAEDAVSY